MCIREKRRLNYALGGHNGWPWLALVRTRYVDNKKLIKNNLRKDSSN